MKNTFSLFIISFVTIYFCREVVSNLPYFENLSLNRAANDTYFLAKNRVNKKDNINTKSLLSNLTTNSNKFTNFINDTDNIDI